MDPSKSWKEIGSKTLHSSWILHRDGRRLVVKYHIYHGSLTELKEIGSKTLHFSWIAHRDGRRLVVKYHIYHGSLTELEGDW